MRPPQERLQGVPRVEYLPPQAHQVSMQGLSPQCPVLTRRRLTVLIQDLAHLACSVRLQLFGFSRLVFIAGIWGFREQMRVAAFDWPSSAAQKGPQEAEAQRSKDQELDVWGECVCSL